MNQKNPEKLACGFASLQASARHWVAGTLTAFAGVAVNRLLAPQFAEAGAHAIVAVTGELIALVGLAIILFGIRRRLSRAEQTSPETSLTT